MGVGDHDEGSIARRQQGLITCNSHGRNVRRCLTPSIAFTFDLGNGARYSSEPIQRTVQGGESVDKVVVLARGLGTRMRHEDDAAELSADQQQVADTGVKALVPFERPFLDYILSVAADAGYRQVCLVIGPEHDEIRNYYQDLSTPRLEMSFTIQHEPKGTADAVLAASEFVGDDPFLMVNSDNHYPLEALAGLRALDGPGLASFDRDALVEMSNIPAERIERFAIVEVDDDGYMLRVHEKPEPELVARLPQPLGVSMNCWRFGGDHIFDACAAIEPSPRGELEITTAVQYAIDTLGVRFRALPLRAPVLDLTSRTDIDAVGERLRGLKVNL
ncbi:MAG: nucleotidyltransferase family protein [Gemmatimonadetes bacterium]|nr:nucleotidyltransferase family protein [Gemmatimonadota bacterium]MBT6147589.1 nucleotidyltransferase family protein [Gemmatimonadota bacterium]MBT7863247.1 nucleotidyltransferase family protein [Gemmatimonadota bacterium]